MSFWNSVYKLMFLNLSKVNTAKACICRPASSRLPISFCRRSLTHSKDIYLVPSVCQVPFWALKQNEQNPWPHGAYRVPCGMRGKCYLCFQVQTQVSVQGIMCQSREQSEKIPILMLLLIKKAQKEANTKNITSDFKGHSHHQKQNSLAKNFKILVLKNPICLTKCARDLGTFSNVTVFLHGISVQTARSGFSLFCSSFPPRTSSQVTISALAGCFGQQKAHQFNEQQGHIFISPNFYYYYYYYSITYLQLEVEKQQIKMKILNQLYS